MQVLIIDDDPEDRELFNEAISQINPSIKYLQAHNGEDGLNLLSGNPVVLPDLIFLDINMPRMDGRECLREIKKKYPLKNISIIMYSTSASPTDIDEFQTLGSTYMQKPTKYSELVNE